MADRPPEPVIEASLRDFLAAELSQAEHDFPLIPRRAAVSARRRAPIGILAAAVAVLAIVVVVPRILDLPSSGTGGTPISSDGPQLSANGLPLSIAGEHVAQGDEIASHLSGGTFLAGGTLVLDTTPCPLRSADLGCGGVWELVAGPLDDPSAVFVLNVDAETPGFVPTSGAPTIARVHASRSESGTLSSEFLDVEAIPWRQPTKGPVPDNATPPEGGETNGALWPDFVSTLARDGVTIAGYVPKAYLLDGGPITSGDPSNPPQALPQPVYGEDLTTLVGHMVPGVGFVALGAAAELPTSPSASVAASVAPSAPASAVTSGIGPGSLDLDCGGIQPPACAKAVDLARSGHEYELAGTSLIVVRDTCPPPSVCDRMYPFDVIVVFVTAGADTTGWYAFHVFGLDAKVPTDVEPWRGDIPSHVVDRLRQVQRIP